MEMYHMTLAADGRRRLFPGEAELRQAIRAIARVAGRELALFNIVDEHLHIALICSRLRAGRLAQSLNATLSPIAAVPLEPARIRPIMSRRHLENLVKYILSQGPRHGLPYEPALWTGSCFLDLIGARHLEGLYLQLTRALPRFRPEQALSAVELSVTSIRPATAEEIFAAGPVRLASATAAAVAVGPRLDGGTILVVAARVTTVRLGYEAGFSTVDLSRALAVTPRAVRRLNEKPVPNPLLRAVRIRLTLEDTVSLLRR